MRKIPPELFAIIKTVPAEEIIAAVKAYKKPKRGKGRPATPDRYKILDLAAKTKAEGGAYTRHAARFHLSPKQITNLVEANRRYFNKKVKEFRSKLQLLKNA
jgi:hypothetical protein